VLHGVRVPEPLRLLFSFARGRGHLGPLMPLARAAQARGHETDLTGTRVVVLAQSGFTRLHPDATGPGRGDEGTGILARPDPHRAYPRMAEVFLGAPAHAAVERVARVVAARRPQVVVCDEHDFGAMAAAERAGVPCVVVEVLASGYAGWRPDLREGLGRLRAAAGLPPDPALAMLDGDLVVVPFPASFRGPDAVPRPVLRVRPEPPETADAHPAAEWLAAGDEPHRAYVTLGTEFNVRSGDLLPRIVAGLATLPARTLVTVGPGVDPRQLGSTPRLRAERHVPQGAVLGLADVVVCHGGSGTLTGALAQGVLVAVLPMGADQALNGRAVERIGAGHVLDAAAATPGDIASAVAALLSDPAVGLAAQAVRREIDALPPVERALDAIEALVARRRSA
jgi:UDP:flavonoid glycosyltransferase YjiC (YdhE family)